MDISVIIPTYKPGGYIYECLSSLSEQTFSKERYEIIIVLNGCIEPWLSDIQEYMTTHMSGINVSLIIIKDGGVSLARNAGLDIAKGKYIAFIDDDDYVSSSYLEELFNLSTVDTICLAYPYAFNDGAPGKQLEYSITKQYDTRCRKGKQDFLKANKFFSGPCMKLIPKDMIGVRRFDARLKNGEDSLFMFLISDRMQYVNFTSRNAIYYRRFRNNSATTSKKSIKYTLTNCYERFMLTSKIYFSDVKHYRFKRYVIMFLGLCHIIIEDVVVARLKR